MSDITPKLKLYIFLSLIKLIINLGGIFYTVISTNVLNVGQVVIGVVGLGTSFIPFVDLISFALMGLPTEILALIGIFTGLLSAIQTVILAMMILQVIHNVIWNPDV